MGRYIAIINRADAFINTYDGTLPLASALKIYFKANRNMGSTDRKVFGNLIFNFFRIKGNHQIKSNQDLLHYAALSIQQLLHSAVSQLNISLTDGNVFTAEAINKMLQLNSKNYFPICDGISDSIDKPTFFANHFFQANTFLRVLEGKMKSMEEALESKGIGFTRLNDKTLYCASNYPLTDLPEYKQGIFEIQDIASQSIIEFLQPLAGQYWWDCCCGSGGKSLLLLEKEKGIQLFATDVRESILKNYSIRLQRNGYGNANVLQLDLEKEDCDISMIPLCDGIIADVPCSGSGTWSRTPEWLHFFNKGNLHIYCAKQKKIVQSIIPKLKSGGVLIYITCSVYREENELNISFFTDTMPLRLQHMQYLQFSHLKADTLFVAEMIKT